MTTELPNLGPSGTERSKKAAALAKYQLELARELCIDVFKKSGDDELAVQIAAVIATNYLARATEAK